MADRAYENANIERRISKKIFFNGRKNLITRCINNLLDNSMKYAEKIIVNLEKKNSNILLSIEDNGPGVEKSEFKNITKLEIELEKKKFMNVLFDPGHDMEERIITEQFNN